MISLLEWVVEVVVVVSILCECSEERLASVAHHPRWPLLVIEEGTSLIWHSSPSFLRGPSPIYHQNGGGRGNELPRL